jgi:DNA-binding NarL/FixJ family response regulator
VRLLIVEDEPWVRRALAELVSADDAAIALEACATGGEALQVAKTLQPTVALVDIGLPDMSGSAVIAKLRTIAPGCVSVAFTKFDDAPTILEVLRAGARGYILKSTGSDRVLHQLREAESGGLPLSPAVASLVVENLLVATAPEPALTERETELLALLARGATYAECATALGIGLGTVQSYVKNIYAKLEVTSKAEAAVAAVRRGLVR